jgi:hypothetical protein
MKLHKSAKNSVRPSEGAAEGGCGGNSAAPERWSTAALLVQSRSQQKSFLFLLEEKIRRAQKKSRENFFAGCERKRGGGANQLPFRSKKVRAKCKISPPSVAIALATATFIIYSCYA